MKVAEIYSDSILKITNGFQLWNEKENLFPNLIFCENVKNQIQQYTKNEHEFKQILRKLIELEKYFSAWNKEFDFKKLPFKTTLESETRTNKLSKAFEFVCPDNIKRTFDWHFRYTPNAGRVYFFPDYQSGKCFIGYIGKKIF